MAIYGGPLGGVMNEKALGKRLQLVRKRAGFTQQELCQKAGLSYSTLAKIERGAIRSPSVFTVASIAQLTGTTVEGLLDLKGQSLDSSGTAKKRSKTGIRFVYFDINGTLVHYYQRAFTEAAHELGVPADVIETHFWRHNDAMCSGEMALEAVNESIAKELGVKSFDWHKYYMDNVESVPGMDELVKWAAEHFEVGLLSNNAPGFIQELMAKNIIPSADYKVIVDSSKVHCVKPEEKIYKLAQEMAAAEPNEILLIDDTRPFLTAADHLGWQILAFDDLEAEDSIQKVRHALEF